MTSLDIPGGGDRVVKEFYAFLEGDGLESLITHSSALMVPMFHMMCDVYVHGGVVTLLDVPGGANRVGKEF